jgi:hypothetical protein
MPIDSAVGLATFGPDGHTIAYNRIFRNFRTWKRYNGGLAQQVFTYDFNTRQLTQITDWSGTNTSPMWYGRKIYYLSDQDANRRANIWVYDQDTKQTREVTHFTDYDIDFPAWAATPSPSSRAASSIGSTCRASSCARSRSACPTTIRAPAARRDVKDQIRASTIRPAGRLTPWRPTASARCSRRAATSSACRPRTARRAT